MPETPGINTVCATKLQLLPYVFQKDIVTNENGVLSNKIIGFAIRNSITMHIREIIKNITEQAVMAWKR